MRMNRRSATCNIHDDDDVDVDGGDTDEDKEEVGHRKIQDQHVRCVLHLGIRMHLEKCYEGFF